MIAPKFVENLIDLLVFCAVILTLLTQLGIRTRITIFSGLKNPVLTKWHRRSGWFALGVFVLGRIVGHFAGIYPASHFEPSHLTHAVLSVLCAVGVLGKIWVMQRELKLERSRVFPWRVTTFISGTSFTILTFTLTGWLLVYPVPTWDLGELLIYRAAILGHVGLSLLLIWLGRLALKNRI
jgi:hypothetical protein